MGHTQIIIAIVAIWGASLSTYTAIRNFIKDKFRVKVELGYGILPYGPQYSKTVLLKAANIGNRTVTLSSRELKAKPPTKEKIELTLTDPEGTVQLPCELAPGKSLHAWKKESDIIEGLRNSGFKGIAKIFGVYRDAIGNSYKSKPLKIKINALSIQKRTVK